VDEFAFMHRLTVQVFTGDKQHSYKLVNQK
jgi:hypothetical protein